MPWPTFEGAGACSSGMTVDGPDIFSTGDLGELRILIWSVRYWFLREPWTLEIVVVGTERGRRSLTAFILGAISLTYRSLEHGQFVNIEGLVDGLAKVRDARDIMCRSLEGISRDTHCT